MHAIHKGQNDAALALMALGADIHADRENALHMAAGAANVAIVRALLAAGADPHQRGGALMAEAVGGAWDVDNKWQGCDARTQVVRVLLAKAPDLRIARDPLSSLSLAYVQRKGCTELLALVN